MPFDDLVFAILFAILLIFIVGRGIRERRRYRLNDLSRWKAFGGHLERPAPPAPIRSRPR